ncbi:Hypothetical protein OINT_2001114 [Brucella intermedia LMG 3301]|uniref:Uncharacterized protein n=1 Tax=Brucella intermedia LMG 3301 TaxID=641118 RepID=C4WNG7_9HYPH|nr:Hypothetical protein OINT_2001114 [Brucella intermedia LMG 3301]
MERNPTIELEDAPLTRGQKNIVDALAAIYPRRIYINDLVDKRLCFRSERRTGQRAQYSASANQPSSQAPAFLWLDDPDEPSGRGQSRVLLPGACR